MEPKRNARGNIVKIYPKKRNLKTGDLKSGKRKILKEF